MLPLNEVEMGALCSQRVSVSASTTATHGTFCTITQERVDRLISYFCGLAEWVGGGALSIWGAIRYSIWPSGGRLGFRIPDCNCRTGHLIDFIFLWHRGGLGYLPY
jgi:hypothetical protein